FPIDQDFFRYSVTGERIAIPDHQVGVFANVDRTDSVVDAHDPRGIYGDHLQCFFFGGSPITDGFGGFLIQAAVEIFRIAFDGHAHALAHGHHGVPWDRIPGLLLVAPPVGKGGDGDIVGGELVSHLVCF